MDMIQIVTTTSDQADAQRIARGLLERRLAACVQISGPIESHYWWQGVLESSREWVCTVKTRRTLYAAAEEAIRAMHPYEVPEIVALAMEAASPTYQSWLEDQLA